MSQKRTLWQRIDDNYNANTVSAKVGTAATIIGFIAMVAGLVAEANGYITIAPWAWKVATAGVLTALFAFTARPMINHFDGDENT